MELTNAVVEENVRLYNEAVARCKRKSSITIKYVITSKIVKWGNSLGVRIPKAIVEALELKNGSEIEIAVVGGVIHIRNKRNKRYKSLKERVEAYY